MGGLLSNILENQYVRSLIVFILFVILSRSLLYLTKTYVARVVKKHKSEIENAILNKLRYPITWLIVILGLNLAIRPLEINNPVITNIIKSAVIILLVDIILLLSDAFFDIWKHKWKQGTNSKNFDDEIFPLFLTFLKVIIIFLGFLVMLGVWGIKVGPLIASLGILGIAVGFALQGSLGNILGGMSLIFDKTFKIGDVIKLEAGEIGEVTRIGLRSTSIRTFDNELIIIPNSQLSMSRITNYARPDNVLRIRIPVAVEYGSDVDKVRKVLLDCVKDEKGIEKSKKPEVRFMKMGDFSLDFELLFFIDNYKKRFFYQNKITSAVYKSLRNNDIGIPFPTRTVYMGVREKAVNKAKRHNKGRKK